MSRAKTPFGLVPVEVPRGFPGRVSFIKSAAVLSQAPHLSQIEVCFCGRSNVGKSTLINTLCNRRQLARVSSTPGRTRLLNFFDVQQTVTFVDLPGYGYARAPKVIRESWGKGIETYLRDRPQLALALLLVDVRRTPKQEERDLLEWFRQMERRCLIVATKVDKVSRTQLERHLQRLAKELEVPRHHVLPFSSLSKLGRDTLWGIMLAAVAEAGS